MAISVAVINDMTNATDDDLSAFQTDVLLQEGVFKKTQFATPLIVTATGTPDKNSNVAAGVVYIPQATATPAPFYRVLNDATVTTLHSDTAANPRIDAVVMFMDLGAAVDADATNVASITIVEGAEAGSPTAPSDGDIDTAVGAATWVRLADIAIANPFVSITGGNITDQRPTAYIDGSKVLAKNAEPAYGHQDSSGVVRMRSEMNSDGNVVTYDGLGTIVKVIVPPSGDIVAGVVTGAGNVVEVLSGTHSPSSEIIVSTGTKIYGHGIDVTKVDATNLGASDSIFKTADAATGIEISDMLIGLIGGGAGDKGIEIISTSGANNDFRAFNLKILNVEAGEFGIHMPGTSASARIFINNVTVNGTTGTAFFLHNLLDSRLNGLVARMSGGTGFDLDTIIGSSSSGLTAVVGAGTGFQLRSCDNFMIDFNVNATAGTGMDIDNTNQYLSGSTITRSGSFSMGAPNSVITSAP